MDKLQPRKVEEIQKEYAQIAFQVGDLTLKMEVFKREIEDRRLLVQALENEAKQSEQYWKTEGKKDEANH